MRIVVALLTISFVLLLVGLTLLNQHEHVAISLWIGPGEPSEVPLSWILWGCTLSGVVFTGLIAVLEGLHLRLANGRLRGQVNRLKLEIDDLRTLPLRAEGDLGAPPGENRRTTAG